MPVKTYLPVSCSSVQSFSLPDKSSHDTEKDPQEAANLAASRPDLQEKMKAQALRSRRHPDMLAEWLALDYDVHVIETPADVTFALDLTPQEL